MSRLVVLAAVCFGILSAQNVVPVPKATLLPITPQSRPLAGADHILKPLDLAKLGYVEEEYLVTGTANVYDWAADGSLTVKTPNAPYGERILVRRPANASRFSGAVMVEIPNTARRFDWPMMWGYLMDEIIERGDAWVMVTMPAGSQALKTFNPSRYAGVSFANPDPNAPCPAAKGGPSPMEEGLRWDIFSQVAALLKSNATGAPMAGFRVQAVYMTTQSGDIVTYIDAIHSHARLANGKPAYDGYLLKNGGAPVRINQCAAAPAVGDPRRTIKAVDVPVVNVVAQGDLIGSLPMRKADSDDPAGRYRLYEIAGAAHIDENAYPGLPSLADQTAAVGSAQGTVDWPFAQPCDPPILLSKEPLLKYSFHAALMNLDQWARKGVVPPKAARIEVKDAGTSQAAVVLDEAGNGKGGVRSPFVDAPVATYLTSSPGPGNCGELGRTIPLDPAKVKALDGDAKSYSAKVAQSVDRAVKEHFFTESDGKKMKELKLP